jgi:hypothetical protein
MPQVSVDLHVLRDALLDRSLSQVGDSLLQTSVASPVTWVGVPMTPSAQLSVRVFNRPEDRDDDGVFAAMETSHIAFDRQSAWIKYKLSGKLQASPVAGPAAIRAGLEVALTDYRVHRATDRAFAAMVDDLDSPRSLLQLEDVQKLEPGEALQMEIGGSLSATVTATWSDLLGAGVRTLFGSLSELTPLAIKLESGLTVTAAAKITDQFSVVISRTADQHYRIAVKKARSRNHTFGLEVGVALELSGVKAVEEALEPAFASLVEAAGERKWILDQIEGLRKSLRSRLNDLVKWKLSAGFAWEYARIEENTAIADYILLHDTSLPIDYRCVLDGDWASITRLLREDRSARTLVRYLNETTLTRRSSAGFSIGLGRWVALEARDRSTFTQSTRRSLDGFQLITSRGTRKYSEKGIPQNDFEWVVDLDAKMNEYLERPTSRDFDYGLQAAVILERRALSEHDLTRMLDFASMWTIHVPEAALFEEAIGRKGTLRVQFSFDREMLGKTLAAFGDAEDWAEPLAAALPYLRNFPERRSVEARTEVYREAWAEWIAGATRSRHHWGAMLRPHLRSGIRLFENRALPGSFAWTVGEGHPRLRSQLDAFVRGARILHDAITNERPPSVIGEAYAFLEQGWSQRLTMAAMGRYLMLRAADADIIPNVSFQAEFAGVTITS